MISYPEAIERITAALSPPAPQICVPGESLGAGVASPIASRLNVPDFDNAAVDGIAVRAADLTAARDDNPVELEITGVVPAGYQPTVAVGSGQALEIMTGAPLPAGADAVVPVEQVEWRDAPGGARHARVAVSVTSGRNVRRAGEDFHRDDALLARGAMLTPQAVMALAAGGVDDVTAVLPARVAVITTGSELAVRGAPTGTGRIRDSNGPYLAAAVAPMGGALATIDSAQDEPAAVADAIRRASRQAAVVLTTGGVSAGRFDCVPEAVQAIGGEILFHRVAIRPGKPLLFARLDDGCWLFGLPGNPVAVAVGLRFFVAPALRALRGLAPERLLPAVSSSVTRKRANLRFFGKAVATVGATGRLEVELLPGQESFKVRPLLAANCWAVVPEGPEEVASGQLIEVAPLHPTDFLQPV